MAKMCPKAGACGACAYNGVKYSKQLEKKPAYEAFLNEIEEIDFDKLDKSNARFKMNLINAAKIAFATPILLKDLYDYQVKVTRQQLVYGIYKMYLEDLDKFISQ